MGNVQCARGHAVNALDNARRAVYNGSPLSLKKKFQVAARYTIDDNQRRAPPSAANGQYDTASSSSSPASLLFDEHEVESSVFRSPCFSHDSILLDDIGALDYDTHSLSGIRVDFNQIPEDHPYLFRPIQALEETCESTFGVDPDFVEESRHFGPRRYRELTCI